MPRPGDLVELHYVGTLDDGTTFDTSRGRTARFFVLGAGQLIPAFEQAIYPMQPGETRRIRLSITEAYGESDPALVFVAPRAEAPEDARVGDEVALVGGRPARITALTPDTVTVDGNHPLAGLPLNFEIELLSIRARPAAQGGPP